MPILINSTTLCEETTALLILPKSTSGIRRNRHCRSRHHQTQVFMLGRTSTISSHTSWAHPSVQIVASQSHHHMNFAPAKIDDVGWDQRLPDLLVEVHRIHWWVQDFQRVKTVLKLLLGNLHSFFNTFHFGQDIVHHVSSCQFISHPPWVPRALRPCFPHQDPRHKSCILSWPSAWLRTSSWSAPSCSQGPSHGQWGSCPWQPEQVSAPPWS